MSRRRIETSLKIELVERYLNGEIGINEVARLAGIRGNASVYKWVSIYKNEGPVGLLPQKTYKNYSAEVKLQAVNEYLSGYGSKQAICEKYGIRSPHQLQNWLKKYHTHGEIESRGSGGGSYMSKARTTTYEERLKIVQDCLADDKNYGATALKYHCSYQQVRNWVLRYEKMGSAGLEDRRGKRAGSLPSRSPEEELRDKIAKLERRNQDLQMENDLLKKVSELERKDRSL